MRALQICVALVACLSTACESVIPPTAPEEQAGRRAAAPVIAALEKFRHDRGHYPAALRELIPRYLPHVRQIAHSSPGDAINAFQYIPRANGYTLAFSYFAAGFLHWRVYTSEDRKWHPLTLDP